MSVIGGGGIVARDSHVSPHKRAATSHCVESDPSFHSAAAESTCSDSHRQQSDGSLHKPAGRSPFHSAAEHSQTAAALGAHTLALHQSSVYSRCIECALCFSHMRQSSAGSGCVCASAMAQDAPLRIPSCSVNPLVPGPSAGRAAVSFSESSGSHGCVMVSMPAAADIRSPVGTPATLSQAEGVIRSYPVIGQRLWAWPVNGNA